jgi:hypothetical protein
MCWEQSRFDKNDGNFPKRSDDNRAECRKSDNVNIKDSLRPTYQRKHSGTPSAEVAQKPR